MIAFCCDAGTSVGLGHLMRCVALAEELAARGHRPVFVCDVDDVPWAAGQLTRRGYQHVSPADDVVAAVAGLSPAAVVLDSYLLPPSVSRAFRARGLPVLAIVDDSLAGHDADLYVDQNLGAETRAVEVPAGSRRLAGLDYALLRDDVVGARPEKPVVDTDGVPSVFAFFGGTDAFGAAPLLTAALAATGVPFDATVVTVDELRFELGDGQRVTAIPPTDRLASYVAAAGLVLSAAGTSTWELLCLGAAAGVVRVVDNQHIGYDRTVATGAVTGLGGLDEIRRDPSHAVATLRRLLTSPAERASLRDRAWRLVDGAGRSRVADALESLIRGPS